MVKIFKTNYTYSEWINNPDEIMMYLSSTTIKQFNNRQLIQSYSRSNFNLNGYNDTFYSPQQTSVVKLI